MEAASVIEFFSVVSDPRIERAKKHSLISILMIGLMSTLAGGEGFNEMEDWGEENRELIEEFLLLENGIPSHDTFRRVFGQLEPKELEKFLVELTKHLSKEKVIGDNSSNVIAIDGKTLRRSFDRASKQSALHLVSAWAASSRLVLGQVAVDEKSNEITAIPELLRMLSIKKAVVTLDAMGTQKTIAEQILDQGGDYVLALKKNHGNLYEDVKDFFEGHASDNFSEVEHSQFESIDKEHGRIETRTVVATGDIDWSGASAEWKGLVSFVQVQGKREIEGKVSNETRYYISSLSPSASVLAEAVRAHWGIENKLHWMLDVNFREDYSRVRKDSAPRNLAVLRKVSMNILRANPIAKKSFRRQRLKASWNPQYLLSLIFNRN
jgi:predicted transposase YbfD/YdcC